MASPSPADVAAERQATQAAIARHTAKVATDAWAEVDPGRIAQSWALQLDRALAATAGGQMLAAQGADTYVRAALEAQGADVPAAGVVDPRRLAGVASDGRSLVTLLREPVVRTLEVIGQGVPPAEALRVGQVLLDMIVRTQVADAGRAATGIGITSRGVGYVRQLAPPSCSRCVVLAGKFYRWNTGFQRHPRCDCVHVPTAGGRSRELARSPRGYFDSLSAAEQDRTFGKAGAQAIRDGSDVGQVVNARRGMQAAGTTTESTTRHGVAARGRLMPEEIYRRSQGDRDEALRLLRLHGYLR
jgi:hypothetical protein